MNAARRPSAVRSRAAALDLLDVGRDYVAGWRRDDLGNEPFRIAPS